MTPARAKISVSASLNLSSSHGSIWFSPCLPTWMSDALCQPKVTNSLVYQRVVWFCVWKLGWVVIHRFAASLVVHYKNLPYSNLYEVFLRCGWF